VGMKAGFKFDWGQLISVKANAPSIFRPGTLGSVVGMGIIGGIAAYTIEFGDGTDLEIAEEFLMPAEE
jgi:hypothetical protein